MIALKQIFKPGRIIAALMLIFLSLPAWAQSDGAAAMSQEVVFYTMVGVVFAVAILVLLVAVYVLQLMKLFIAKNSAAEEVVMREAEPSTLSKLWEKWNSLRPMEQEADIMMDHDYDGIN